MHAQELVLVLFLRSFPLHDIVHRELHSSIPHFIHLHLAPVDPSHPSNRSVASYPPLRTLVTRIVNPLSSAGRQRNRPKYSIHHYLYSLDLDRITLAYPRRRRRRRQPNLADVTGCDNNPTPALFVITFHIPDPHSPLPTIIGAPSSLSFLPSLHRTSFWILHLLRPLIVPSLAFDRFSPPTSPYASRETLIYTFHAAHFDQHYCASTFWA